MVVSTAAPIVSAQLNIYYSNPSKIVTYIFIFNLRENAIF